MSAGFTQEKRVILSCPCSDSVERCYIDFGLCQLADYITNGTDPALALDEKARLGPTTLAFLNAILKAVASAPWCGFRTLNRSAEGGSKPLTVA